MKLARKGWAIFLTKLYDGICTRRRVLKGKILIVLIFGLRDILKNNGVVETGVGNLGRQLGDKQRNRVADDLLETQQFLFQYPVTYSNMQ